MMRVFRRYQSSPRAVGIGGLLLCLAGSVLLPAPVNSHDPGPPREPFHVAVFTPTTEGNTYWPEVHRVMRTTETSLNIDITFHEFGVGDRFAKAEEGVQILHSAPVPDAAIFSVAYGQAEPLMDAAEALGIPFFLHGPLFPREIEALGGGPRKAYQNWIGYFRENEQAKGYLLARELITAATDNNRRALDGTIRIVGISGDATWYGTTLREAGLRRAAMESPRARLLQVVPTRWTQGEGREMTTRLLSRYSDVTVVWSASDQLALGAAEALEAAGLPPGAQAFTGGLDLSLVGLEAVRAGILTATVAAPSSMWAQILQYLSEYLHGHDFADQVGTEIIFQPEIATPTTAEDFIQMRDR